jgi:hypothetical protein
MKKGLLGSTALVAASLVVGAGSAQAANEAIKLGLGGYMEQWVGFSSQDDQPATADLNGLGTNSDTEVWFLGSTTLDNGITFGVNIQLEGNTTGDTIDESYMIIKGDFGEINLGSENSAQYKMQTSAPEVGIGMNSGDQTAWVSFAGVGGTAGTFRGAFGSTYLEAARANDVNRITYYTPRFAGFQVGASYAPAAQEDGFGSYNRNVTLHDGFSVGANYNGEFNGVSLTVAGGYGQWTNDAPGNPGDPSTLSVGASVGFMGVTVGGSYGKSDNDLAAGDMTGWDVGASYGMGPWAVSAMWFHGERDGLPGGAALPATNNSIAGSVSYAVGPGINFKATVASVKVEADSAAGRDNEAIIFVMGPTLRF